MHRFRFAKVALFTLLLSAALLVSGCAAKDTVDKQDYIKKNNAIQTDTAKAFQGLDVTKPASIDAARKELESAIQKLDDLEPPADYKKPHRQMIDALKELDAVLGDAKSAMAAKDVAKLKALTTRMNAAQAKFNAAIDTMNKHRT
jgi:hypothetical protein